MGVFAWSLHKTLEQAGDQIPLERSDNKKPSIFGLKVFEFLYNKNKEKSYVVNTDIRHVRFYGVDFWIPNHYKLGSYDTPEIDQYAVLLQVLLPDLQPRTPDNVYAFRKVHGHGDRMQLLINDISKSTDFHYRYMKAVEMAGVTEPIEVLYGFDDAFQATDPDHVIMGAKFYIKKNDNDEIKTYLTCRIDSRVKDPGCSHYFMYQQNIRIHMHYSEKYLPDWQKIENQTIALLDRLRIQPVEGDTL